MHGLLPPQWAVTQPPGNHHACTSRDSSDSQPDQAAAAGGLSLEPGGASGGLGHRCESTGEGGRRAVRETQVGVHANLALEAASGRSIQMKTLLLAIIRFYQACISPTLPSTCRYFPSCSSYACEAVEKWGAWLGARLALRRVLRCRPWGGHGFDPVPVRTVDEAGV